MKKVVVLTDYSLLAQGIVSRLRQTSHSLEVEVVDFRQTELLETLVRLQPEVVIIGSKDVENSTQCQLNNLFNALPNLMVIELNLDHSTVQLIRSGQYNPTDITSLVTMLESNNNNFPEILATIQSG